MSASGSRAPKAKIVKTFTETADFCLKIRRFFVTLSAEGNRSNVLQDGDNIAEQLVQGAVELVLSAPKEAVVTLSSAAARAGIDEAVAKSIFKSDEDFIEAISTHGVVRLSDYLIQRMITVPPEDGRAGLIEMGVGYVKWARENRNIYEFISNSAMHQAGMPKMVALYDKGFLPLVQRFLGENADSPSFRALFSRCFIFGMADIALNEHLEIWMPGADPEAQIRRAITDFADMVMAYRGAKM